MPEGNLNLPKMARSRSADPDKTVDVSASEMRRAIGSRGPAAFAEVYLPHLLKAQTDIVDSKGNIVIPQGARTDFASWHYDVFNLADTKSAKGIREAVIAPRGSAKSTIISIIVLYWAAYQLREFVLWTSETASQVEELVASLIDELESNSELLEDFPHLAPAKDGRGNLVKFTDRDLMLRSGFRLSARGRRKATRGLRRGSKRPDVVIMDDSEGEDSTGLTQYPKTRHWLTRVIGPALAPNGDIFFFNTLIDWVSITGALIRQEEDWTLPWNVRRLEIEWDTDAEGKVIDPTSGAAIEGAEGLTHHLLWPEFWPQERIDAYKAEFGIISYMYELRNRPLSDTHKIFQRDTLRWCTIEDNWVKLEDSSTNIRESLITHVTALDPAFGGKDYAAVVTVAIFNHEIFVREAWWERGEGIRISQVDEARRQAEYYNSRVVVIESIAAQIMVADEFMRKSRIPVRKFTSVKDKVDRALPVAVRAGQGHVYFDQRGPKVRELRDIVANFPSEAADDPVDAFVMAVEGASELKSKLIYVS